MNHDAVRTFLSELGEAVSLETRKILVDVPLEVRTRVHGHAGSDIIYDIDHRVEQVVVKYMQENAQRFGGIVLIAEGIGESEKTIYPAELPEDEAALRIIVDPIDGTRPIMYDKRSAFFLAGAAPNSGPSTRLGNIEVATMVEIPTTRAASMDSLWAIRGGGARGERINFYSRDRQSFVPQPSSNPSIHRGFVQFVRFFSPGKGELGLIEDELMMRIFPAAKNGENLTFEDQYLSTGAQLYEMLTGKDRFVADVRTALFAKFANEGKRTGHPCHPYDLAASLIATEAGIIMTLPGGEPFDAPMDTLSGADWIGYANTAIRQEVEADLTALLSEHGLLS